YFKPICEKLNATHLFRRPEADQDAELTAEYLVDTKAWAVGSPATVAALIREQFERSGGFGTLLQLGSDYANDGARQRWCRSMELLATEVRPLLRDLRHGGRDAPQTPGLGDGAAKPRRPSSQELPGDDR